MVVFDVKWFRLHIHESSHDKTINEHANIFTMVDTRKFEPRLEPYVLPSQCEHVFYIEVPFKGVWSYVVRYDPREGH